MQAIAHLRYVVNHYLYKSVIFAALKHVLQPHDCRKYRYAIVEGYSGCNLKGKTTMHASFIPPSENSLLSMTVVASAKYVSFEPKQYLGIEPRSFSSHCDIALRYGITSIIIITVAPVNRNAFIPN